MVVAIARIETTYPIFSQTTDEPLHIAAGFDWWRGKLNFDVEHPPLARILFGFHSAVLDRAPDPGPGWVGRGNALLLRHGRYSENLAAARRGALPFLVILIVVVWRWAARDFGPVVGIIAAAIVSMLPPILGHAGVATTDIPLTAMFVLACYALRCYLDSPTIARAAFLGLATGLGIATKFSFLLFFPVAALVLVAMQRNKRLRIVPLTLAIAIAVVIIAALYRFEPSHFIDGLRLLQAHARRGHPSYLFGELAPHGRWYYFPVALFFKTPLALFVFVVAGARHAWIHIGIAFALLLSVLPSTLNLGIRHILVLYPSLAIVAAVGIATLWKRSRVGTLALASWFVIATSLAHPDYIANFNEAAGREPGRILLDSNLDWGQDALRLIETTRALRIPTIGVALAGTTPVDHLGLPPRFEIRSTEPSRGWMAVSEEIYRVERVRGGWFWLEGHAYRRVGKSIRLYHVP